MTKKDVVGDPPPWMGEPGVELWKQLKAQLADSITELDRSALILTCASYASAYASLQDLNERGPLIEGERGMVKNPANQVSREQAQAFRQWCAEFGLTPAARKRLAIELGEADDGVGDLIT